MDAPSNDVSKYILTPSSVHQRFCKHIFCLSCKPVVGINSKVIRPWLDARSLLASLLCNMMVSITRQANVF